MKRKITIVDGRRVLNSRNGNARYEVTTATGETLTTAADHSFALEMNVGAQRGEWTITTNKRGLITSMSK